MAEEVMKIGPYEIRGELGRGAMARVWRAWDPNLAREVAIKEPLFDQALSSFALEEMGKRFVAEGRAAAKLNHENIVTIYAADIYDGRPAIVMELVDGVTLGTLLFSGPLSPVQARDVLDQLLDAVGYAHSKGVVHRDIKPENIFITREGRVKLADFGIAHVVNQATVNATVAGSILGSPGYMSPEQAKGGDVDERSDLFSVGIVGYEMLTGQNPFAMGSANASTMLYRIVHEPVPELPTAENSGIPESMRVAIMHALEKEPNSRPASAQQMKDMLHGSTLPAPNPVSQAVQRAGSRFGLQLPSWLPFAAAAALPIGVVIGLAISFVGSRTSVPVEEAAQWLAPALKTAVDLAIAA